MRTLHKEWKNGRHLPLWTCRITWYQGVGDDIRLEMVDCEHPRGQPHNFFPVSRAQADIVWALFKQNAPPQGMQIPVISKVLTELEAVPDED